MNKIIGNLILNGNGKNLLKNATISPIRNIDYIIPDWDYQDIFNETLHQQQLKQILNNNPQIVFDDIIRYISFSKQYKLLPTTSRIKIYFFHQIKSEDIQTLLNIITKQKKPIFQKEDELKIHKLEDLKNIKTIIINKKDFIELLKNKKIQIKQNMFYFNNIRIVSDNINNIMVLTNNNTIRNVIIK